MPRAPKSVKAVITKAVKQAVKLTKEQIAHEIQQTARKIAHKRAGKRYSKLPTAVNKNKNLFNKPPTKNKVATKKKISVMKKAEAMGKMMKRPTLTEFMNAKKAAEKRASMGMKQKKVTVNRRPAFTDMLNQMKKRQPHGF